MNPRDFCRMPGYKSALALTYNFDPLFFERIVLHDLWQGGTSETVVLADSRQLLEAVPRYVGQLRHLGRSYSLAAAGPATCHPKIILRLGSQGAALWIGSANLTQGGWGGNRELATSCVIDADDSLAAAVTSEILLAAGAACLNPTVVQSIEQFGRQTWLTDPPAEVDRSPLIMTRAQESLAAQLQRRWSGRRFTTLRLMTGSTDKDGAFIEWCGEVFGVEQCVVAVNPMTAAFRPSSLERLSVRTTIVPNVDPPHLHAKFYWFDGPDGSAAVVGSANCSRAAWMMPLESQGNLEAVIVYDQTSPDEFPTILSALPETGVAAASVKGWGDGVVAEHEQVPDASELRLLELSIASDRVTAVVDRPIAKGSEVELEIGEIKVSLSSAATDPLRWEAAALSDDRGVTEFGRLVIRTDDLHIETRWHWIDNKDALLRSSRRKALGPIPRSFDQFASKREKDQLLADIALLTKTLLSDPAAFADPVRPKRRAANDSPPAQPAQPAQPVQPGQLLRELAEIETNYLSQRFVNSHTATLSLHGVLEAFFGQLDEEDEAEAADEPELGVQVDDGHTESASGAPSRHSAPKVEPATDRQRNRLIRMMETFRTKLLEPGFVQSCTASQLVQAAAYPLLIAALGRRGGWLSNDESRRLLLSTADTLFRTQIKGCEGRGLIDAARSRFESLHQLEVFDEVVADGALWLALVGAIAGVQWDAETAAIERAIVLREVLSRADLLKSTNFDRLGALAARLRVAQNADGLIVKAELAHRLLGQLEDFLTAQQAELMENQRGRRHETGDLAWVCGRWGSVREGAPIQKGAKVSVYWRWHGETVKMAADGTILNVHLACTHHQEARNIVDKLSEVWN